MQNQRELRVSENGRSVGNEAIPAITIERMSELFPEDLRDRFRFNMNRMASHDWESRKQKAKTKARVRAMCDALDLKLKKQAELQYLKAEGEYPLDYSKKVVKIGRKEKLPVKLMGTYRLDDHSQLLMDYKGKNWAFIPIVNSSESLPPEALRSAVTLKEKGIIWDELYVGKPVVPVTVTTEVRKRDPIFAARVGSYLIQLLRWT